MSLSTLLERRTGRPPTSVPTPVSFGSYGDLRSSLAVASDERRHAAYAALVRAAARHLDAVAPGWAALVDPTTLDLVNPFCCVLAQVFGGYGIGLRALYGDAVVDVAWLDDWPGETLAFSGEIDAGYWLPELAARGVRCGDVA